MNPAAQPFDAAGLVAISFCGHWWRYPWWLALDLLHELVTFHARTVCSFCVTEWEHATSTEAWPVIGRRT